MMVVVVERGSEGVSRLGRIISVPYVVGLVFDCLPALQLRAHKYIYMYNSVYFLIIPQHSSIHPYIHSFIHSALIPFIF